MFVQAFGFITSFMLGKIIACFLRNDFSGRKETQGKVTLTEGKVEKKGVYLVHSIRDDGGQSDSICPLKAFSVGETYFPFTVRSSSLRLGC